MRLDGATWLTIILKSLLIQKRATNLQKNDPKITPTSIPGASQDALAANFLLNVTFPCYFLNFGTPGTLKIIDFPLVFQCFSEIRLPSTGPKQAPQNDPEMGANSDPGGLQKAENDDVK